MSFYDAIRVGASGATDYEVERSLRFNDGDSPNLTRTPSSASNRRTFTISAWVKRSSFGAGHTIISQGTSGSDFFGVYFPSEQFSIRSRVGGSDQFEKNSTGFFRDLSAWMHVLVAVDTTQSTAEDRAIGYLNGVRVTNYSANTIPAQNTELNMNTTETVYIGSFPHCCHWDGYIAELQFIDGQALTPSSFGETNTATGIWTPKKIGAISGAGNNSFYLDFKDSSNLGNDASGLNNDFTVNNLTSIDQSTDTCVENYATFNGIAYGESGAAATFGNGNLDIIRGSASWRTAPATIGALNKGKWYYECKVGTILSSSPYRYIQVGVISEDAVFGCIDSYHDSTTYSYAYHWDGTKYVNNSASSFGSAITSGSTVMIALDFDNNYIYAGLDGTWQNSGDQTSGSSGTGALSALQSGQNWFPTVSVYNTTHQINFGNPPYSISSGNSDANGHGNFEYAVPSGYYALNTSNLNTYG